MLVICEKNMAARRIAYILSNGKYEQKRIGRIPFYKFGEWKIIGLKGHPMKLDYPREYNRWNSVSPPELIKIEPHKISHPSMARALKKLSADADKIIVATDYDREGELIGTEGLEIIGKREAKRARFSSLTYGEVKNAFKNLEKIDYDLSKAAEARQRIDLVWGAVLTRFISLTSNQLGKNFLSVGRVQSPTLALIVEREKEIENFKPTPYWVIEVSFDEFKASKKIWDESEAKKTFGLVKRAKDKNEKGIVTKAESKKESNAPPPPFDTTSFLKAVSFIKISAASAMKIAEELYMRGIISYPRTDNTVYPKLPINIILKKLKNGFPKEVDEVTKNGRAKPMRGKKMATDHPPIHPVDFAKLEGRQQKIYELIARRFLATLAKDSISKKSKVIIDIEGEEFEANGYEILEKNWRKIYPYIKVKERKIPEVKEGDLVRIIDMKKIGKETKPPNRYSQGSLIGEMERLGLGTKSTRHEIIQKLYRRRYVSGNYPSPTPSAIAVTEALKDNAIIKPEMTANLEKEMDEIANEKMKMGKMVEKSRKILSNAMESLERKKEEIGKEISRALSKQNFFGKCPSCGNDLFVKKSRKGKRFIGCTNYPKCKNSYPLPQKGKIYFNNEYCDECGSPIVTIIMGKKKWKSCASMDCSSKKVKRDKKSKK